MQENTLEAIKLFISILALLLSLIGLVSSVIFYVSSRASICNQIYTRWQTILLAQTAEIDKVLTDKQFKKDEYRGEEYYITLAYLNLYEEVFFYQKYKLLYFFSMVPETLWQAMERSITAQFKRRKYIRTLWQEWEADGTYSDDFVAFVRELTKNTNNNEPKQLEDGGQEQLEDNEQKQLKD